MFFSNVQVPKKLPPGDGSMLLLPPAGEALTTVFNPDMESPCAELGNSCSDPQWPHVQGGGLIHFQDPNPTLFQRNVMMI